MEFCEARTEEHGFLTGQEKDWVYIDWADLDKDGPLAAEQMLYAACWKAMAQISAVLGQENPEYLCRYEQLTEAIQTYYWDQVKGAYIDSFTSGKRFVTRQSNIFAVLFGIADEEKQQQIIRNVIYNEEIPAITTPYFNFFELDMLCRTGNLKVVIEKIRSYWGGMLDRGAVTFWEEFDPSAPVEEQYDMYGDKFGKSLCHAWSASPIYFLSKYFMGLKIQEPGAKAFLLEPHPEYFREFACTLPAGAGNVHLQWDGRELSVETDIPGGILNIKGESITLIPGQTTRVTL
jgi:hypothetical protein